MLARGNSAYGDRDYFSEDRGFESQEDLAEENNRLKQELTRIRRCRSSSVTHPDSKLNGPRRSTLGAVHGRTQEQLREVIEENDHLNERLKIKEQELKELAQELQEAREDFTRLREKISEDEHREFEDDDSTEKETSKDGPKDIRLFKKHAQDMMRRLKEEREQDLAKADQAKKLLKMQLEDCQKRNERSKAEVYRMERELSQSEAYHAKTKAALQDLQHHYDEVRGMLEGQKDTAEQMRVKVRHLEEELETERLRSSIGGRQSSELEHRMSGDTLDMLDGFMNPRFTVADGLDLHGADDKRGADPEISGQLKEQLAELHQECEQLRSQLALAEKVQAQQEASRSSMASSGTAAANAQQGLRQECEGLRGRLGAAEAGLAQAQRERESLHEHLAQSKEAAEAARRSVDARAGLASRAEELQRECDRLREQLSNPTAPPSGPQGIDTTVEELRQENERLRRQLSESLERQQQRASWAATPVAVSPEGNRLLAGERAELLKRNEELLHECHDVRQRLQAAESKEAADAPATVEELRARRHEGAELRERLHTARMAELEAHRKADIVPELMTKIIDLQAQVAAAEKDATDWRELANGPSWAGMFSSFMCAAPERRPAR